MVITLVLTSCQSYKSMLVQNQNEIAEVKVRNASIEQKRIYIDGKIKNQEIVIDTLEKDLNILIAEDIKLNKTIDSLNQISDKEITAVTRLFVQYLNKISDICKNNPPPCVNAANGWMRQNIVKDEVNQLANKNINVSMLSDGRSLMNLYSFFAKNNQNAFLNNPNAEDKRAIIKMFQDALRLYNIYTILSEDIAKLYLSNGSDLSAWKKSKEDSDKLLAELRNNRNVCRRGRHANGWIADWVNTGSSKSLELLNKTKFYSGTNKAERIKAVLSLFFTDLSKLQTNSQCADCPFLPAEWQIGYGLMFKTTADKLIEIIN